MSSDRVVFPFVNLCVSLVAFVPWIYQSQVAPNGAGNTTIFILLTGNSSGVEESSITVNNLNTLTP